MLGAADLDYVNRFERAPNPQRISDTDSNSFSVFGMASDNGNRGMVASSSQQGSEGYHIMRSMAWS